MDPEEDEHLLYIAEWALLAPVPNKWTVHLDDDGVEFFRDVDRGISQYEHPSDELYRLLYQEKKQKQQDAPSSKAAKSRPVTRHRAARQSNAN